MAGRPPRSPRRLALAACVAAAACARPVTGPPASAPPAVALTGARVDAGRRVVVTLAITQGGVALPLAAARALWPAFTLAALRKDPVSGFAAWESALLLGADVLASLPVAGPGTPPALVQHGVRQPWCEDGGELADAGGGRFTYRYATPLPGGWAADETLRAGVWLRGVAAGTRETTSTLDFVPAGGPPESRELVRDENCDACHAQRQGHAGSRTGWRMCVTCHTWQNADPDTVDPAAMAGATPATNPNPLAFGQLVHRVHRGTRLPTLYRSAWTAPAPPRPYAPDAVPLPFGAGAPGFPARNAPLPGTRYSVVDDLNGQGEVVFGAVEERGGNGQPPLPTPVGLVHYPQDLRNCDACHAGAAQRERIFTTVSRRTCQDCHADVWFGEGGTDATHFPHPGGPKADDAPCAGCHLAGPDLQVPVAEVHVPPYRSARWSPLEIELVSIEDMKPGSRPTVRFRVKDRVGPILSEYAPDPPADPTTGIPRLLDRMALVLSGPAREYRTENNFGTERFTATGFELVGPLGVWPTTDVAPSWEYVWAGWQADADGAFTYTFQAAIPADATGTWAVGVHVSRGEDTATRLYDPATDRFLWPYTGEAALETARDVVAYVDLAAGRLGAGDPTPRRKVVDEAKCNACHDRREFHDGRTNLELCVMCHAGGTTDWNRRPKDASGRTNLSQRVSPALWGTYDGIEERSVNFSVLMHEVHTGARSGSASLGLALPFAVYGFPGGPDKASFFGDITLPRDLGDCTMCHVGTTYELESIEPGLQRPTLANETGNRLHEATAIHADGEPATPPMQSACRSCHDTRANVTHTSQYTTVEGVERCLRCHGRDGPSAVSAVHHVTREPAP